jgi:pyridoxal phosphate enzyme (YggS family)
VTAFGSIYKTIINAHPNTEALDASGNVVPFGTNLLRAIGVKIVPEDAEGVTHANLELHLIGPLQTNKVKFIAPFISMIHSVDSAKLLGEIQKYAQMHARTIDCLLQLHVAQEETKFGMNEEEFRTFLESRVWEKMPNVRICGCMAMASLTDDEAQIAAEFAQVQALFLKAKTAYFAEHPEFKELSIGMSSDFKIALAHGSTMVRIGSAVFQS